MTEFNLKKEQIVLKFGDQKFEIRKLKFKEQREFSKKLSEVSSDADATFDLYIEIFKTVGVPEEIIDEFNVEAAAELMMLVMGGKKKES